MEENTQTPQQTPQSNSPKNDVLMGILSYLGILCLIPYLTKKDDPFVRTHAKQGLVIFIIYIAITILRSIIISPFIFSSLFRIINTIFNLLYLGIFLFSIWGMILVIQGKQEEMPLIGQLVKKLKL